MISGRGSNLAALLELREEVDIRLVVSSRADAHGLLKARRAGVPTLVLDKKIDWPALDQELRMRGITHVFLAGFMRVIPAEFLKLWQGRVVNLHPSLLPSYPGLNSIARAYQDAADIGVTVHEVSEEVDAGQIIARRRSLKASEVQKRSLRETEFLVHVDEQRMVKEVVRRWRNT